MSASPLISPIEGMKHVRSKDGEMLAKPFIEVCKLIVPIVDKFGMSMAIVKADISGNISKLESKYTSDPSKFEFLYDMVRVEIETKTAKSSTSCTTGVLWLTRESRAMDFLVELLRNLMDHSDWSMTKACMESYNRTLKRWHGWLATSSFNVALKIIPDRKRFLETIACGSDDINADIQRFCSAFSPLLEANHKFLIMKIHRLLKCGAGLQPKWHCQNHDVSLVLHKLMTSS